MQDLVEFLQEQGSRAITITSPDDTIKPCMLTSDKRKTPNFCLPLSTCAALMLGTKTIAKAASESLSRTRCYIEFSLEFWEERDDYYESATSNHISRRLWKTTVEAHGLFSPGSVRNYAGTLARPHATEPSFPKDLVFTWVNANDQDWQKMFILSKNTVAVLNHQ